jgi:hypothetical protein
MRDWERIEKTEGKGDWGGDGDKRVESSVVGKRSALFRMFLSFKHCNGHVVSVQIGP